MDEFDTIRNLLKFCPICGEKLEVHPTAWTKACFTHGEFVTITPDDRSKAVFEIPWWMVRKEP